jgi:hypothetical protein
LQNNNAKKNPRKELVLDMGASQNILAIVFFIKMRMSRTKQRHNLKSLLYLTIKELNNEQKLQK